MRKRNYTKVDRGYRAARRKKVLIFAGAVLAVYLLASFVLGEMGLVKYYRMKSQFGSLTDVISTLKKDNTKLSRDVQALKTDPARIERIARDKLGLARPGEIVYYYGEPLK
jgi:cell division protein FtsB